MTLYGYSLPGIGELTPDKEAELLLNSTPIQTNTSFNPTAEWVRGVKQFFGNDKMRMQTLSELCSYNRLSEFDWDNLEKDFGQSKTPFAQQPESKEKSVLDHVRLAFGYPDEGSYFDEAMGEIKYTFRDENAGNLVPSFAKEHFFSQGYDAIIANYSQGVPSAQPVLGHVSWQKRPDDDNNWHLFSVYVRPDKRKQGLGVTLCEKIVGAAREEGVERIRFGDVDQGYMRRVRSNFSQREAQLGVQVADNMYVDIKPKSQPSYDF